MRTMLYMLFVAAFPCQASEAGTTLPERVVFETIVVCDSIYAATAEVTKTKDLEYYVALFFNSVNQRFNSIHGTTIRFLVVEIVEMNTTAEQCVLVFHQRAGVKYVNATATLPRLMNYAKKLPNFTKVDAVVLLTSYKTFYKDPNVTDSQDTSLSTITPGDAFPGGICTGNKVAISEDSGRFFDGVGNTARQLALLIGATFDTKDGPQECNYFRAFLMGTFWTKEMNHHKFSNCSSWAIKQHLIELSARRKKCFKKNFASSVNDKYPKLAPGSIYNTVEDYCRLVVKTYDEYKVYACPFPNTGGSYYDRHFRDCDIRCCVYWGAFYTFLESGPHTYTAPDGMTCGYQKVCRNKQCVGIPINYTR